MTTSRMIQHLVTCLVGCLVCAYASAESSTTPSSCGKTCNDQDLVPGLDPHSDGEALYGLTIRPAASPDHNGGIKLGAKLTALGRSIHWLVFAALDVPWYRMALETSHDLDAKYDVIINLPESLNAQRML